MVKKAAEATPNHLLQAARKERGWTQKEVADRIGAPQSFNISRWEQGTAFPSVHYIQKLCLLFGKSAKELGLLLADPTASGKSSTEAGSPPLWNVPYRRNPFFTNREQVLERLHERLVVNKAAVLTQTQAISGLGGVGKTQIAVEYAYRYRETYRAVFWVRAATRDSLISDFVNLAHLLELPEQNEQDQQRVVEAVRRWLANASRWLLILDNADDLDLVVDFLPTGDNGQILLTTRAQATGGIAPSIPVEKMGLNEGILLLLRRAKLLAPNAPLDQVSEQERTQAAVIAMEMDGLPLALDQAGAYVEETGCDLAMYPKLFRSHHKELLSRRSQLPSDHPEPVAASWALSFLNVEQVNPAAADLLRLCAFLDPDTIPESIITIGAADLGVQLGSVAADQFKLNEAIEALRRFSLVRREPKTKVLNIHRLVQAVLKDEMDEQTRRQWSERAVRAVNAAFPEVTFENWQRCQEYLPHAQACAGLIEQYNFIFLEAARLLTLTGWYLRERAQYAQAELLLQRALTTQEQVLGTQHLDIAHSLNNLARLYRDLGKNEQAEPLLQRALAIQEQVLGPLHPDIASSSNNLARFYHIQGKLNEAEPLYQRALAIMVEVKGPEHPDTATCFLNLLGIHYVRGKYEQAESILKQALAICEQVLSPEHPYVATTLTGLAALYYVQDELDRAKPLLQRSLAICEQARGLEHPSTANALNNLGMLYFIPDELEQGELLVRRALAIQEQVLGSEHPSTALSFTNLAMLYYIQGKLEQAEPFVKRAMEIIEKTLGPEHPFVANNLNNLALIYIGYSKLEQAEPLLQRALLIFEKVMGPENHFTALTLNNLAVLYHDLGKYAEAETLYKRILTTCENGLVPNPLDVAVYLENYASLLREMKQKAEVIKQDELKDKEGGGHRGQESS